MLSVTVCLSAKFEFFLEYPVYLSLRREFVLKTMAWRDCLAALSETERIIGILHVFTTRRVIDIFGIYIYLAEASLGSIVSARSVLCAPITNYMVSYSTLICTK